MISLNLETAAEHGSCAKYECEILGGCPRIAIVARGSLIESDFLII